MSTYAVIILRLMTLYMCTSSFCGYDFSNDDGYLYMYTSPLRECVFANLPTTHVKPHAAPRSGGRAPPASARFHFRSATPWWVDRAGEFWLLSSRGSMRSIYPLDLTGFTLCLTRIKLSSLPSIVSDTEHRQPAFCFSCQYIKSSRILPPMLLKKGIWIPGFPKYANCDRKTTLRGLLIGYKTLNWSKDSVHSPLRPRINNCRNIQISR